MNFLRDFFNLSYLGLLSKLSRQKIVRVPEPNVVTTDENAVRDYDRAMESSLSILYGTHILVLKLLLRDNAKELSVLDLACGPGIFTSWMAKILNPKDICGLDLSEPMLESSRRRFGQLKPSCRFDFIHQNITDLSHFKNGEFNLVTFMEAAHHLPTPQDVTKVLREAERVCSPQGIIFVSDLVRPKNEKIFKIYYDWISLRNKELNMPAHNVDFLNSLRASWTSDELAVTVPQDSHREWYQLKPIGFEYMQVLLGLPAGTPKPDFKDFNYLEAKDLIPKDLWGLWRASALSFKYGTQVSKVSLLRRS